MSEIKMVAPCHFGLESVVSGELKRMGANKVAAVDGKVYFSGETDMLARANLNLRSAERVQIVLGEFEARSFTELFDNVKALAWENYIGRQDAFPVKGWSLNSALQSIPDCQSIIKKAVVERLKEKYEVHWFEEVGPVHQIQFSILKDKAMLMLDTSGAGLHKRGYRANANIAPIKETLAAGILDIARIYPDTLVYDPFCGSGTFLIEAAFKALNIAPGIKRKFVCEKWGDQYLQAFVRERALALDKIRKDTVFRAYGFDLDDEAVKLSQANAKKAGMGSKIRVAKGEIAGFTMEEGKSIVVCNPPYGERMLEVKTAEEIYVKMGKAFPEKTGKSYFIISPHEDFERFFGRKADKKRKLYNGMIKCNLFMYLS